MCSLYCWFCFGRGRRIGVVRSTWFSWLAISILILMISSCIVKQVCYDDNDCVSPKKCIHTQCQYECTTDSDCDRHYQCSDRSCTLVVPTEPGTCPVDMILIENIFCIDPYEAARPDATESSPGEDQSYAVSKAEVMPWRIALVEEAIQACEYSDKRLCEPSEWTLVCQGPNELLYSYGSVYEPETCNGIDTFQGAYFTLKPTGSFPECRNTYGVYDMNGNLWELTSDASFSQVRGGAYNCGNSLLLHQCTYIPTTWNPSAVGFRCCKDAVYE